MKKILLTTFTGAPDDDIGGPNKIIYNLIAAKESHRINYGYLSKHLELRTIGPHDYATAIKKNISNSQKIYKKSKLFRWIVNHPLYLRYHHLKTHEYFHRKSTRYTDVDVIHSHDVLSFYHFRNAQQKKILTIHSKGSVVSDFGDYNGGTGRLKKFLSQMKAIENESVNKADIITFPSHAAKLLFLSETKIDDLTKIHVIYNGIDYNKYDNILPDNDEMRKRKQDEIFIFNVADHIKVKNIEIIIRSIKPIEEAIGKKVKFINAGTGPRTKQLIALANNYGLDHQVIFLGKIENTKIAQYMKMCDYFISASDRVIFDVVILEAMACGSLILASNNGGNKEIIVDGINGYLFDNNSIENLVNTLVNAKCSCKKNAKKNISQFSIKNMYDNYHKLYNT